MCRWGCTTTSTTYMCKFCGTRFCKECLRGDFTGEMMAPGKCKMCHQKRCQGTRVEYVPPPKPVDDKKKRGASSMRGRSSSPTKSAKSAKAKSAKGGRSSAKRK